MKSSSPAPHPDFTGLIAAPLTAMHEDGSLNLAMIKLQSQQLSKNDVRGAFICGTTGEGISLTTEERMQVAEAWIKAAQGLRIIVHISHPSIAATRRLIEHAAHIGAHAVASMGPIFFRPSTLEELVNYCANAASSAPDLPFYFYHIPSMTGVNFPMFDFLQLGSKRISNLAGVKFTCENLMDFRQCLMFEPERFDLFFGRDEMLLAALAMGARGAVGSTYNFAAPIYHQLIAAYAKGDMGAAQFHQSRSIELITILSRYGFLAASKALISMQGIDCGPVRPPLQPLSPAQTENLRCELAKAGFLPAKQD